MRLKISSVVGILLRLVDLGFKDPMVVGDLVMRVPLLFTWLFPLGTCHALSTLDPLHMYVNQHSLLSIIILYQSYMNVVVLGHLQKRANEP